MERCLVDWQAAFWAVSVVSQGLVLTLLVMLLWVLRRGAVKKPRLWR
jgi:hypothetical protein